MRARNPDIFPPDEVLTEIGRVAVAAAGLDAVLAHLHVAALGIHSFDTVTTWPAGRIRARLRTAADQLPDPLRTQLHAWVDRTEQLALERDRAVHAFTILSFDHGDFTQPRTSAVHPRSGTYQVHDPGTLNDLALRIGACAAGTFALMTGLAEVQAQQRAK